jgi:hypothetical protein
VGDVIRLISGLEGKKKNDNNTYYLDYSKKCLPEQNLLLDESQEKIWDLIVIKNFEKKHAVQLICCVREWIYQETINYYWLNQ